MRIVPLYALSVVFLANIVAASEYKPRWSDLPCQICIERPEEQGILNIRETRIIIDDQQALILVGGQAACVFVSSGKHFVYAESYDPYDPTSRNQRAWLSNKVSIDLEKGKRAELELGVAKDTKENRWQIDEVQ